MTKTARNVVIAAALVGGLACASAPAVAASFQEDGDFGGSWSRIGPSDSHHYRHRYVDRVSPYYYAVPGYGPAYAYDEPYYDYGYGPSIAYGGPDFGVSIDLD